MMMMEKHRKQVNFVSQEICHESIVEDELLNCIKLHHFHLKYKNFQQMMMMMMMMMMMLYEMKI
jgi:hypothetical protein